MPIDGKGQSEKLLRRQSLLRPMPGKVAPNGLDEPQGGGNPDLFNNRCQLDFLPNRETEPKGATYSLGTGYSSRRASCRF